MQVFWKAAMKPGILGHNTTLSKKACKILEGLINDLSQFCTCIAVWNFFLDIRKIWSQASCPIFFQSLHRPYQKNHDCVEAETVWSKYLTKHSTPNPGTTTYCGFIASINYLNKLELVVANLDIYVNRSHVLFGSDTGWLSLTANGWCGNGEISDRYEAVATPGALSGS